MKLKYKNYLHFDKKMSIRDAKIYLKNLYNHEYLPFITYEIPKHKWNDNHIYSNDTRTISVSSHKDNYVYQYFNNIINAKYESYIKNLNIDKSICAFRKKLGKCNIDFFKEIIPYIIKPNNSYILIADISKFYDNLDHNILKNNLKKVLNTNELPIDTYKMFKSITKSSYITINDIHEILKQEGIYIPIIKNKNIIDKILKEFMDETKIQLDDLYRLLNEHDIFLPIFKRKNLYKIVNNFGKKYQWETILTKEQFKKYKSTYIKPSKECLKNKTKGIVQGSPISGTLSNIYMIDFDEKVTEITNELGGKYLRYCDDMIIVIPNFNEKEFKKLIDNINILIKDVKLDIKKEKYQIYKYENKKVINLDSNNKKNKIQFLGLELKDNGIIDIRQSTKDRNRNKYLKLIKKTYNKKEIRTNFYKRFIENGPAGNYKNYTYGNYLSKVSNTINRDNLKILKKKEIEFMNKHIDKKK